MGRSQGTITEETGHHDRDSAKYDFAELLTADVTELVGSITNNDSITGLQGENLNVDGSGTLSADHDHESETIRPAKLNMTPLSSPPAGAVENDIYLDDGTESSDGTLSFRQYDGTSWNDI